MTASAIMEEFESVDEVTEVTVFGRRGTSPSDAAEIPKFSILTMIPIISAMI